ncbi:hypothetical protein [Kocuria marina]|uniref:hypothetical protein n=1 Tax=Kocuria marina TaxID=223184 RepID=UPI0011A11781|nr:MULTISPECIES: hypothetical protein [Kocuria]MCT2020867.1 hypothetical protein [Kocuria marina]
MSPSTARDPLDDGNAPWTEPISRVSPAVDSGATRPLPRPGVQSGSSSTGDTAALPPVSPYDDARSPARDTAPRTGRTGVASGRLHPRDGRSGNMDPVGDDHLTPPSERISAEAAWDSMRPAVRPEGSTAATRPTVEELRARQRQRFGGMQLIPGVLGLLTAISLGGLLLALAGLVGPQLGLDMTRGAGDSLARAWQAPGATQPWIAVAVLGAVEFLSMLSGGYVAGRMARFSGVAQGVSVWLWSLLARAAASVVVLLWADATAAAGPRWVVQELIGRDMGMGLIALAGLVLLGLAGAILGGAWGMRYHRKVDAWTVSNAMS